MLNSGIIFCPMTLSTFFLNHHVNMIRTLNINKADHCFCMELDLVYWSFHLYSSLFLVFNRQVPIGNWVHIRLDYLFWTHVALVPLWPASTLDPLWPLVWMQHFLHSLQNKPNTEVLRNRIGFTDWELGRLSEKTYRVQQKHHKIPITHSSTAKGQPPHLFALLTHLPAVWLCSSCSLIQRN